MRVAGACPLVLVTPTLHTQRPSCPDLLASRVTAGRGRGGGTFCCRGGSPEGTSGHLGLVSNFVCTQSVCRSVHAQSRAPALCQHWVAETKSPPTVGLGEAGCQEHGQGEDPCTGLSAPPSPSAAASHWGSSCPLPACLPGPVVRAGALALEARAPQMAAAWAANR